MVWKLQNNSTTMSSVDLATLTLHRRNELETRINSFLEKSGHAIKEIKKLELQAQSFVQRLNCEPSELKEQFLSCMRQLEEYTYLITDFNLALGQLEEVHGVDFTPVLDSTCKSAPRPRSSTFNIIDVLSESAPSKSTACSNLCPPEKVKKVKVPKAEQTLIEFSSSSCSSESVPANSGPVICVATNNVQTNTVSANSEDKEVQCEVQVDIGNLTINEGSTSSNDGYNLPAQSILETERLYPATIMSVDGASFWVITEDPEVICRQMKEMTDHYMGCTSVMSLKEVTSLHYCAFYDDESDTYYRAFFIKLVEDQVEVFLVDTGEMRTGAVSCVRPLAAQYCDAAPYARCCHLAGVDTMLGDSKDLLMRQQEFMMKFVGVQCHIEVDDNSSESMGVYVILSTKESVNELMVKEGLAIEIDRAAQQTKEYQGPPEMIGASVSDMLDCPEYEDPVEAVTGYHNRDEEDICKHYRGGPDRSCFKGARCKKRHVLKHPDGWTLDKVEAFVCKSLPLPAPDTYHKVVVTCVCHYNRLYVQFVSDTEELTVPSFGVVRPPTTLSALVRDMNSPASRLAYKPLTTIPALGEMVAALYPLDEQWYRARVVNFCRAEQNVEVMYVDYGNIVWVNESAIRLLNPRWAALPAQAIRCRLAGVHVRQTNLSLTVMYVDYGNIVWVNESAIRLLNPRWAALPAQAIRCRLAGVHVRQTDCRLWARARECLHSLVHQRTLHMHVVGRDYDEITVELFDDSDVDNPINIAEELAKLDIVELEDYSVEDDTNVTHKMLVP